MSVRHPLCTAVSALLIAAFCLSGVSAQAKYLPRGSILGGDVPVAPFVVLGASAVVALCIPWPPRPVDVDVNNDEAIRAVLAQGSPHRIETLAPSRSKYLYGRILACTADSLSLKSARGTLSLGRLNVKTILNLEQLAARARANRIRSAVLMIGVGTASWAFAAHSSDNPGSRGFTIMSGSVALIMGAWGLRSKTDAERELRWLTHPSPPADRPEAPLGRKKTWSGW